MRVWRALFPPQDKTSTAQTVEINRGRPEERSLTAFVVSATGIGFPFAEQAAQLTRRIQIPGQPAKDPEIEYLVTSRASAQMNAQQMLEADRKYRGIENGLHQRLDVIAGEDRSRVRGHAALNLAVSIRLRRACRNSLLLRDCLARLERPARRRSLHARARVLPNSNCIVPA